MNKKGILFMGLFIVIYSLLSVLVCVGGGILISLSGTMFGKGLAPDEIARLKTLLILMTFSTALSFPVSVFSSTIIVYERYVFSKSVCIAETILSPILNLVFLYAGTGSAGLACAGLLGQVLNASVCIGYCMVRIKAYPVFKNMPVEILPELIGFCTFVFLSSIVDMLYWATDKVLIAAAIGSAAVAVYNVGGTFTAMLQNMAHAISNVFSPRVNLMVARQEPVEHISELMIRIGRLQYLVISLILSGYIVFGPDFILLWAGPEYADAYYIGLLTMIPLAVPLIQNVAFATILAQNKHRFRSIVYAIIAVLNVVFTWLVLPRFGIIGAAACTAASFVLGQGIIMNFYYHWVTKLDIPCFWMNIGKQTIVPCIMSIAGVFLVRRVVSMTSMKYLLLGAVVYTIVFAALSWLISMNNYEKNLVLGLVRKVIKRN